MQASWMLSRLIIDSRKGKKLIKMKFIELRMPFFFACRVNLMWSHIQMKPQSVSCIRDLFVIVVNLCRCARCQWTFISEEIDRYDYKITLYTLVQNYGWPAVPFTI